MFVCLCFTMLKCESDVLYSVAVHFGVSVFFLSFHLFFLTDFLFLFFFLFFDLFQPHDSNNSPQVCGSRYKTGI